MPIFTPLLPEVSVWVQREDERSGEEQDRREVRAAALIRIAVVVVVSTGAAGVARGEREDASRVRERRFER